MKCRAVSFCLVALWCGGVVRWRLVPFCSVWWRFRLVPSGAVRWRGGDVR